MKRYNLVRIQMRTSKKSLTNLEISELLRSVAAAYQLKDAVGNKFRIVAYERAADAVEHSSSELKDLWDEGKLDEVPGIGKSIAEHLTAIFETGRSKHFEEILAKLPKSIFKLMEIPGIGVKTAFRLVTNLPISDKSPLKDLQKHAKEGKIAPLEGFGKESQADILKSIGRLRKRVKRYLLPYALEVSSEVVSWLLRDKNISKAEPLGSLRRRVSTIGDIDIAIASKNPQKSLKHFTQYPKAARVLEIGEISSSIIVGGGMQVDVIALPPTSFGSLIQHFTGSKQHNIALREYALKKHLSLSEKGIKNLKTKKLKKFDSEDKFYNYLGLQWIPPEIREGAIEINEAKKNNLPVLVQLNEVVADLQIHSDFDIETSHDVGQSSMEEIVKEADRIGLEYIAFTEHNPSQKGHSEEDIYKLLASKREKIERLNSSIKSKKGFIKAFNSLEIDILPDGRLPVSDRSMELLDFALVSIHSSFDLPKKQMTMRILSALSHPKVKIWAHPTGRLLQKREGIEADFREIFDFCVKNNKWVEINADPMRLDLPDYLVLEAKQMGVKFTLGTDSHNKSGLSNMQWAISVARRGWLEKEDIINTRNLRKFTEMLEL